MRHDLILANLRAKVQALELRYRAAEEHCREIAAQRDRQLTALQVVEEMLASENGTAAATTDSPEATGPSAVADEVSRAAEFDKVMGWAQTRNLTIEERAIVELEKVGKFISTDELVKMMVASGYKFSGKSRLYDVIYSGLHHVTNRSSGSRIRLRNATWGLREWLPAEKQN